MALKANLVPVTNTATKLFDGLVGEVTITGSATFTLGGAGVTSSNGMACPANTPVRVSVNGEAVYAVTASTANVGYIIGDQ